MKEQLERLEIVAKANGPSTVADRFATAAVLEDCVLFNAGDGKMVGTAVVMLLAIALCDGVTVAELVAAIEKAIKLTEES